MIRSWAVVFPGQGSQQQGMLSELGKQFPVIQETFAEASQVLGFDLWQMIQDGPEEALNRTQNTQPAMLTSGIAVWRVLKDRIHHAPDLMAGHSLGEYSALVAAESLDFVDAVHLVRLRAEFMQSAVPEGVGGMAAILGMSDENVIALCADQACDEVLEAVNFNSMGQVVIAGHIQAVQRAVAAAPAAGARKSVLLPVSVPSHCQLMRPAAERLAEALAEVRITPPSIPVLHNVTAATSGDSSAIRQILAEQLYRPVRWVDTIRQMGEHGVTRIIEVGSGRVLAGLGKRIDKTIQHGSVFDLQTLEQTLEALS